MSEAWHMGSDSNGSTFFNAFGALFSAAAIGATASVGIAKTTALASTIGKFGLAAKEIANHTLSVVSSLPTICFDPTSVCVIGAGVGLVAGLIIDCMLNKSSNKPVQHNETTPNKRGRGRPRKVSIAPSFG